MDDPLFQIYTNTNNVRISKFCVEILMTFMHDETEVSVLSSNESITNYIVEGCFNRTETIETVLIDASRPE